MERALLTREIVSSFSESTDLKLSTLLIEKASFRYYAVLLVRESVPGCLVPSLMAGSSNSFMQEH